MTDNTCLTDGKKSAKRNLLSLTRVRVSLFDLCVRPPRKQTQNALPDIRKFPTPTPCPLPSSTAPTEMLIETTG